ncbi:hypothetical protein QYE76_037657 [Lolium multiflorum]|uniref:Zinc finger GRF-type domain-containing protein n=1 Tax=Lolium multiflorum TaxID=4521 RepID=A0AAD8QIG2_LOLMU|nr:hypothetical protein QYE76_037657 [Lolium multiflorum]
MAAGEDRIQSSWQTDLVCRCDLVSMRRQMKSGKNKKRWYYKCCNWEGQANACLLWIWEDLLVDYVFQYCRYMVAETKKLMSIADASKKQKLKADRARMTSAKSKRRARAIAALMTGVSALPIVGCSVAAVILVKA